MLRDLVTRPPPLSHLPGENSYRFVLCVDIEGVPSLFFAYSVLRNLMSGIQLGWETSDECYGPNGDLLTPEELQHAIDLYYAGLPSDADELK